MKLFQFRTVHYTTPRPFHHTAEQILSRDKFFFLIYWVQHPREIKQKVSRKSADGAFEKFQVPNFGFIGVNQSVTEA